MSNGQITVLRQDGWEVRYLRYADSRPDSLPTRLQLSHEDLTGAIADRRVGMESAMKQRNA